MAGSTSEKSKNRQANPTKDYEEFLTRYESLRVGGDGVLKGQPSSSRLNDRSSAATQNPEKDVTDNDDEQTKRRGDQLLGAQETPETTRGFSRNSVSNRSNILGYSNNQGKMNSGSGFFIGMVKFNDKQIGPMCLSENLAGSSIGHTGTNFFYGSSSTSNPVDQYDGIPIWNDLGRNQFEHQISGVEKYGLFSPNEYLNKYNQRRFSGFCAQFESAHRGSDFYYNAGIGIGSNGFLQRGKIQQTRFTVLLDNVFQLMTNKRGHILFDELIDSCMGDGLDLLVSKLWSNIELFIDTAFCRFGSTSIKKLIKKLKKTPHANTMTRILSSRYYQMMTHDVARHVIIQCFNLLDRKSNEILYECAIYYFQELAIHDVGCRSLNECINSITGNQRHTLLNCIADASSLLSNDPYGHYVVQHVLNLKNNLITKKILCCLEGQITQLSRTKGGSHVVEKCIESSTFGTSWVVKEILKFSKTPIQLAKHQFGNFVIQKALVRTKIEGLMHLHEPLVTILEQNEEVLKHTKGGNFVLNVLKELREA